jgi:hypothetical protein
VLNDRKIWERQNLTKTRSKYLGLTQHTPDQTKAKYLGQTQYTLEYLLRSKPVRIRVGWKIVVAIGMRVRVGY